MNTPLRDRDVSVGDRRADVNGLVRAVGTAASVRELVGGLLARRAEMELRNGLRLTVVVLEGPARTADEAGGVTPHGLVGEAAVRADVEPANVWSCVGDLWTITFDGHTVHLRTSKGMADIARLIAEPDTGVHCVDLAGVVVEDRSSGEVIDARARREYEQRVRELQVEIDRAEADADFHHADRARAERDAIVDQLASALGLGGRARRHTDSVERARSAVTQRIRSTIKRIEAVHPSLAAHLDVSVRTGTYCRYRPERSTIWSTAGPAS